MSKKKKWLNRAGNEKQPKNLCVFLPVTEFYDKSNKRKVYKFLLVKESIFFFGYPSSYSSYFCAQLAYNSSFLRTPLILNIQHLL